MKHAFPIGLGALAMLALVLGVDPAAAHHPTGGAMPTTLWHGLLSGFGHPVIGLDHLGFIVTVGIVAAFAPGGLALAAAFIAASFAGVLLHTAKVDLPMAEPAVAATLLIGGLLIGSGARLGRPLWLAMLAIAGIFHGFAYGEAVVGAETGVIGAYLLGLAAVQLAIAAAAMAVARRFLAAGETMSPALMGAGYALSALGAVFMVGALVSS